jgi:hypothetical protein
MSGAGEAQGRKDAAVNNASPTGRSHQVMKNWTTPESIRAQMERYWNSGKLLACVAGTGLAFPIRLPLRGPASRELSEQFDAVRSWITQLERFAKTPTQRGYRVVMREVNHRVLGANTVPTEIWIDSIDDGLAVVGKQREAQRFKLLHDQTSHQLPALLPWVVMYPLRALELANEWTRLMEVTLWLQQHPRPRIYLRQIDLPGIDSKFIEQHKTVLRELFDLALAESAIDASTSGQAAFARRYGFREKPVLLRFRILDEGKRMFRAGDNDISVTSETFAHLDLDVDRVFITENEINFLAFPPVADAAVVFGSGYGFQSLSRASWMRSRAIHYWGDIDTHGLAILDSLRAYFKHARSFLMDRETLLVHRDHWIVEAQPVLRDLERLTQDEQSLFDDLRHNRLGQCVRLEQEKIGFGWLNTALNCQRGI